MTLRKLVAVAIVSTWGIAAFAAPTPYGLVRKEVRQFSQSVDLEKTSYLSVADVAGGESRFGFKGGGDLENSKYTYQMEFGVQSNTMTKGSETAFGIRLAKVGMEGNFGAVTIGQDWSPISVFMATKVDFLAHTIAGDGGGGNNANMSGVALAGTSNVNSGEFYMFRSRLDMVQYATPSFAGFKGIVTYDTQNKASSYTAKATTDEVTATEISLAYENKDIGLNVLASQWSQTNLLEPAPYNKNGIQLGAAWGNGPINVSLGYGSAQIANDGNDADKLARMFVGFKYALEKLDLALTYGTVSAGSDEKDSQIGFGATYKYTAEVSSHFVYKTVTYDSKSAEAATTDATSRTGKAGEKVNTGTWIGIGTTITF